jgi:hypothetical protein
MVKNIQAMMHERTVHYKEALISVFLGLPDGITYLVFGFIAGEYLAAHLGLHGIAFNIVVYIIAIGAALGVAFFAVNNVSREYSSVFKKTMGDSYARNSRWLRILLRVICVMIALLSAIPFAGMAMTAADKLHLSSMLCLILVLSNAIARTAMNDYALTHILTGLFNRVYLFFNERVVKNKTASIRREYLSALRDFLTRLNTMPHAQLMTIRRKLFKNPLVILSEFKQSDGAGERSVPYFSLVGFIGFIAGAFTATYIYAFALTASSTMLLVFGMHNLYLSHLIALCGVIPTCFLWGNETMIALSSIFKYLYKLFDSWFNHDIQPKPKPVSPIRYKLLVKLTLILFFAAAGAFSEIKMAFYTIHFGSASTANPWLFYYYSILFVCTPIAFASIYSVCVVELVDKVYSMIAQRKYVGHVFTLRSEISYFSSYAKQFILQIDDDALLHLMKNEDF